MIVNELKPTFTPFQITLENEDEFLALAAACACVSSAVVKAWLTKGELPQLKEPDGDLHDAPYRNWLAIKDILASRYNYE